MSNSEIIKEVCKREIAEKCHNIKIEDVAVYFFVRRGLFEGYIGKIGTKSVYKSPNISYWQRKLSIFKSFAQLFIHLLKRGKYKYFIHSFYRLDKINSEYVDKFTDPLIDFTSIGDNCIVFEPGNNGLHLKPRRHNNKIIYADCIMSISRLIARLRHKTLCKKYSHEFNLLFQSIERIFPDLEYSKDTITDLIIIRLAENSVYKYLFKAFGTKVLIAPSRNDFQRIIPAAKQSGMRVFELQHGFVKNYSLTYSGINDPDFTPDFFLAYGNLSVNDNYGIDIDKIKVIGWAFDNYLQLQKLYIGNNKISDTLIIADPIDTEKLINSCILLARNNPSINFYYRAHPGEVLDDSYITKLTNEKNIYLDDNSQNILVTLRRYTHVIGVNSTVLNEALTFGKKVGILYLEGLCPFNIDGSEDDYYWKIDSIESFRHYINASPSEKKQRKIYSKFDKTLFEQLMNV